ncbi:MFS transporter [Ornithinimicrobium kibberense]|uniref:MFS transporter n=2 Tax=Ornithinimicrobium kibberense TaxID=282060 RepID=A0ABV5V4R3_9MICO|nr:MFS transporter [Ornithinimicrobium kibberense]
MTVTTAPHAPAGRSVTLLAPLALAGMASQSLLLVLAPSMAAVADDLGVGVPAVGQARTVTAAVALAGALVLLVQVSSLGVRRVAVAGSLLAVASGAAVATAPSYPAYLLAHVLVGLAVAALVTVSFAGIATFAGADRSWAAGWVTAATGSSWIFGNPVAGALTEHLSWRATHAIPALLAVGVLALARHLPGPVALVRGGALRGLLRRRQARAWTVAGTLGNVGWMSVLTYVGGFFVTRLDAGPTQAGWLLALGASFFVATSILGGRSLMARHVRAAAVVSTAVLAAATVLLFSAGLRGPVGAAGLPAGAAAFCLAAAAGGLRIPSSSVLGMAQHPERPDVMMTARTGATQVGYLAGAALSGWVVAALGWVWLGPVLAVVLLASAALMARLPDRSVP